MWMAGSFSIALSHGSYVQAAGGHERARYKSNKELRRSSVPTVDTAAR
jgi:hypothetical protein